MAKSFTYTINENPQEILNKVRLIASEKGIDVSGDHQKGQLSGQGINADYVMQDSTLTITVQKKPMIVPWSMVEKMVAKFVDNDNSTQVV
ncbi:MAG TPA: hypothetical protein ENJ32_05705 [Crenotrichaceae bacterium]|nr:hypothetical protein [Crenotrichaceae bacterium]